MLLVSVLGSELLLLSVVGGLGLDWFSFNHWSVFLNWLNSLRRLYDLFRVSLLDVTFSEFWFIFDFLDDLLDLLELLSRCLFVDQAILELR